MILQSFFDKGNDHIWYLNKDETVNRMNNAKLKK